MSVKQNFYDILGVSKTASQEEIKKSYRKLAIKYQQNAYFKLTSETFEVFGAIFTGLHISLDIEISMR